jgi:high-affinity iron transporter
MEIMKRAIRGTLAWFLAHEEPGARTNTVFDSAAMRLALRISLGLGACLVAGLLIWQGVTAAGNPDPTLPETSRWVALLDIGVLVFREGLECVLVLAAITASMTGERQVQRRPVVAGAAIAFVATLITWFVATGIMHNLLESIPALKLQAATGLLAVVVLLVVMNWFFHKIYWGGWISLHTRKKQELTAADADVSRTRILWGLGLLGFASLYREGFEVVLFLQSYYLKMGGAIVVGGAALGLFLASIVAVLTFVAHARLPYRKMLIFTGIMLGFVLLVMVGEQAQEMQQAHWISTTPIPSLTDRIPGWAGLWFSVFPTVETLIAQAVAAVLVVGSYYAARRSGNPTPVPA